MPRQHPARRKAKDVVRFTLTTEWQSLIGGSWVDTGARPRSHIVAYSGSTQ
jgi:hypothetical protein